MVEERSGAPPRTVDGGQYHYTHSDDDFDYYYNSYEPSSPFLKALPRRF